MNTSVGLPFSVVWQLTIPQLFDLVGSRLFVVHYDQHLHQSSVNYVVVALTWLRKGHWFDVTLFVPAAATRSRGRWPISTRPPWSLGSPPPASLSVSWSLACRGGGGARIPGGSLRPLHPRQHCNPLAWQPQCRLMLFLFWPPSKCRRGVAYLTTSSCRGRRGMYEAAVQHTQYTPVGFPKSGDALSTTDGRGHDDDAAAADVVVASPAAPAIPWSASPSNNWSAARKLQQRRNCSSNKVCFLS